MSKDKTGTGRNGRMKSLLIMGGGAIVLLGAGGAAGIYASGLGMVDEGSHADSNLPKLVERSDEPSEPDGKGEDSKAAVSKIGTIAVTSDLSPKDAERYEATYYAIEQNFTANLADGSGFVQLGLSLATYFDGKVIANIERQMVPIRSAVLMVLSEQDAAILSTSQGKQQLQRQLTMAINRVLREKEGFGGIDNVYFTTLVIQ